MDVVTSNDVKKLKKGLFTAEADTPNTCQILLDELQDQDRSCFCVYVCYSMCIFFRRQFSFRLKEW